MITDGSGGSESSRCGFAALVGWTNVGKSTLLNRFVGERLAAVAEAAQTTRNRILGVCHLPGRAQIVFIDTPGFHEPRHRMNRRMIDIARRSLAEVDVGVLVVDAARGLGPGDENAARRLPAAVDIALGVLNKIDRVRSKSRLLPMIETMVNSWGLTEVIPVSALTGEGCDALLDRIVENLPLQPPMFDEDFLTDQPERVLAAEWIREKLLHHTRQELPHATAVVVERWHEREDGLIEISATVIVERDSQKAIVIGEGGRLLRTIGVEAREHLERFLGARVYLRLWVKVRPKWRDDERTLRLLDLA